MKRMKRKNSSLHLFVRTRGLANTEGLRQAMIHYRTLFEELVGQPEFGTCEGYVLNSSGTKEPTATC